MELETVTVKKGNRFVEKKKFAKRIFQTQLKFIRLQEKLIIRTKPLV